MSDRIKVTFKVASFRKIPNPYQRSSNSALSGPEMYILIADVKDLPGNIPMDTNPREQNEKTKVAKKIEESLLDLTEKNFYLLNRGLLLSAKSVSFDSTSNQVSIDFEDLSVHGNVDGGHTYKIIKENQKNLYRGQQFVKVEVLTGIEDIFPSLAAARNTSVQVTDQSIAELEGKFDLIKDAFKDEPFSQDISYKQNEIKRIDAGDILAILNLFNIDRYPVDDVYASDNYPIVSYNGKKACIDYYIKAMKNAGAKHDETGNPYFKMKSIMPMIAKLHDEIELGMPRFYKASGEGIKRYGSIAGVQMRKDKQPAFKSEFYGKPMDYRTPNGFIYPILGAFRALVVEKDGVYQWKIDPLKVLEEAGPALVQSVIETERSLGNNPNATGKNSGLWRSLFLMLRLQAMTQKD